MKATELYTTYCSIKNKIVPELRFSQSLYEDVLYRLVPGRRVWLDAGCGWKLLPEWRLQEEKDLVNQVRLTIGCDVDVPAIVKHRTIKPRVICDLAALPFKDETIDLITCNMVMEHVANPQSTIQGFARTLRHKGIVVIHTPFRWSYFAIISALVPAWFKTHIQPDCRKKSDYYPVLYRCNTPRRMRYLCRSASLKECRTHLFASDGMLQMLAGGSVGRFLVRLELYFIRLSLQPRWRWLRVTMCSIYYK
jgi:SAM-dependent methyltransferase